MRKSRRSGSWPRRVTGVSPEEGPCTKFVCGLRRLEDASFDPNADMHVADRRVAAAVGPLDTHDIVPGRGLAFGLLRPVPRRHRIDAPGAPGPPPPTARPGTRRRPRQGRGARSWRAPAAAARSTVSPGPLAQGTSPSRHRASRNTVGERPPAARLVSGGRCIRWTGAFPAAYLFPTVPARSFPCLARIPCDMRTLIAEGPAQRPGPR
jgi:hypothetical protein